MLSPSQFIFIHIGNVADAETGAIDLTDALGAADAISTSAPLFVLGIESDGSLNGEVFEGATVAGKVITVEAAKGQTVMVDYYVEKNSAKVSEIQIDAEKFAGYYYVEADTLFRRQADGVDMPANITLPNVKIQSNFTFTMASTGDPSTFTFTMDAFPGYTYFDKKKKVLCVIQVIEDAAGTEEVMKSVMTAGADENDADMNDSIEANDDELI